MPLHSVPGQHQSGWHRIASALAAGLCVLLWALVWVPTAHAHATLMASDPPHQAVLQDAPQRVRLTFNEPVAPLAAKIAQPDGTLIDLQPTDAGQDQLVLTLPAITQAGTYALSWRVVSADGHPVGSSLLFSVGAASTPATTAPQATPGRDALIWGSRLAWLLGLLVGVGMSVFQAFCTRSAGRMAHNGYWWLGVSALAALASLGLLGADALDAPLAGLLQASTWRTALATSLAFSVALSWLALVLAWLSDRLAPGGMRRFLALGALAALGLALAASGHASTAPPTWVARPAVWLHTVAATAWVGALLPLAQALGREPDLTALRRFSRGIPIALLVLVASGITLVSLQLDQPASLWQTAYGQVLVAKLALVAGLLALGAYNRWRLTDPVLAGDARARRAMRRSITVECLLALAVLAVLSLWRFTPPPRALDAAQTATATATAPAAPATSQVSMHVHTHEAMAQVVLDPPASGQPGALTLYLFKEDLTPLQAKEVSVAFSNEDAGIEPIRYTALAAPDDSWRVGTIDLPKLSHWQLEIDALVSDFERIRLHTALDLTP